MLKYLDSSFSTINLISNEFFNIFIQNVDQMKNGLLARTAQLHLVSCYVDHVNVKKVLIATIIIVYKTVHLRNVRQTKNTCHVLIVRIAALIIHVQHVIKKAVIRAVIVNSHMSEIL